MDHVDELVNLAGVTSPVEAPAETDWAEAEKELKVRFPKDFKSLVSLTGSGFFGSGLSLKSPTATSPYARLRLNEVMAVVQTLTRVAQDAELKLYPVAGGLLPIGSEDADIFLYEIRPTGDCGDLFWWNIDDQRVIRLGAGIARFLYELHTGAVESEAAELREFIWRPGDQFFTSIRPSSAPPPRPTPTIEFDTSGMSVDQILNEMQRLMDEDRTA